VVTAASKHEADRELFWVLAQRDLKVRDTPAARR